MICRFVRSTLISICLPYCTNKLSKDVRLIMAYLDEMGITYEMEKEYKDCRGDTNPLKFDFHLLDLNILIEYDGIQHFKYHPKWFHKKGYWQFEKQQKYDEIKNQYCRDNNIDLLRIAYYDDVIEMLEIYLDRFL